MDISAIHMHDSGIDVIGVDGTIVTIGTIDAIALARWIIEHTQIMKHQHTLRTGETLPTPIDRKIPSV